MLEPTLGNLAAWAVQVAVIGIAGVLLPVVFRVTAPGARALYLRVVLAACLALPVLQPWVPSVANPSGALLPSLAADGALTLTSSPAVGTADIARAPAAPLPAQPSRWPIEVIVVGVYVGGLSFRLGWLGLGLVSLARLRRQSTAIDPRPAAIDDAVLMAGVDAQFRVSPRVVRPVTFGMRQPVVLVPPGFLAFKPEQQTAVALHELLHVARRDWLRTIGDEFILSVFWFHPALWWLIEQINLSVEQVVDRAVVARVGARKPYLEALLKLAAAGPTPMLQPASLFLKHGHLAQRVALLVREASMSRIRLVASFVVVLTVLATGGWYVVQAFPLTSAAVAAEPVAVLPASPVSAATPLVSPSTPSPAASKPVADPAAPQQATPTVPPKALAPAPGALPVADGSLASYLALAKQYEAAGDLKNAEKTYLELTKARPKDPQAFLNLAGFYNRQGQFEKTIAALTSRVAIEPNNPEGPYTLATYYWDKAYRDAALSAGQKQDLVEKGLQQVDSALAMKAEYLEALTYKNLLLRLKAAMETDPEAQKALIAEADELRDQAIKLKTAQTAWSAIPPDAVRVGGNIKAPTKLKDVKPVYPDVARQARVQGVVIIEAVIGPDGRVMAARVLRSIPLLDQPALDALQQWEFTPTLLNGVAIPVVMTATVNFTLAGGSGGGIAGGDSAMPPPPPPPPMPLPPDTVKVGGGIRPPSKTVDVKAVYPEDAKQAGIQGVVILELTIGKDGKVLTSKVLRSIPALDQAAIDAVRQWEFTPTLLNGVATNVIMTVTVNFTLQ